MKKIHLLITIIAFLGMINTAQAQEYSSNLPVPPTTVAPVTPVPTPTPRPSASPVASVAPMPVSGSVDMTFVFITLGLLLTTYGFYKVKLKD